MLSGGGHIREVSAQGRAAALKGSPQSEAGPLYVECAADQGGRDCDSRGRRGFRHRRRTPSTGCMPVGCAAAIIGNSPAISSNHAMRRMRADKICVHCDGVTIPLRNFVAIVRIEGLRIFFMINIFC